MSTVNFIAATQPSTPVTAGKSTTQQTVLAAQSQPDANATSVTISSSGAVYAGYLEDLAQKESGRTIRQMALEDPNNSYWAQAAEAYVTGLIAF